MIKPDGVKRGLVGKIFGRVEDAGLKLISSRMMLPSDKQAKGNYPGTDEWMRGIGTKSFASYDNNKERFVEAHGTDDLLEVGRKVYDFSFRMAVITRSVPIQQLLYI